MAGTLISTPLAQPREAPLSLLRRAAIGNAYPSTLRFANAYCPGLGHGPSVLGALARNPRLYRRVCLEVGIPEAEVSAVVYLRAGNAREDDIIWNDLFVKLGSIRVHPARMCISCYRQAQYSCNLWDHVAAVACAEHGVLLESGCPVCGSPWTYDQDPLGCPHTVAEMEAAQTPCDPDSASLVSRIVDNHDQPGATLLEKVVRVLAWWKRIGRSVSRMGWADSLASLFAGRWPREVTGSAHDRTESVHPRLVLAPLLHDAPVAAPVVNELLDQPDPQLGAAHLEHARLPLAISMSVLGIERVAFEKFLAAGLIGADARRTVSAAQLNDLLYRVWRRHGTSTGCHKLSYWRSGARRRSLASLIRAIDAGEITDFSCSSMLGLETLVTQESPSCAEQTVDIGLVEAAERLSTYPEAVRRVIQAGVLRARRGTLTCPTRWTIESDVLDTFHRTFVFASEVAHLYGVAHTTCGSRLRAAGAIPVSGPGIDSGLILLFRRSDIERLKLPDVLTASYDSPAGRKKGNGSRKKPRCLYTFELASMLGLRKADVRSIVDAGWITVVARSAGRPLFLHSHAIRLLHRIDRHYLDLSSCAVQLGQTEKAFRRTWIDTGAVRCRRYGKRFLISRKDLDAIKAVWMDTATSSVIGRSLGRHRWLCLNLEKIGLLRPVYEAGGGAKKVKLFPRAHISLRSYSRV